jgi:hypothetical protein
MEPGAPRLKVLGVSTELIVHEEKFPQCLHVYQYQGALHHGLLLTWRLLRVLQPIANVVPFGRGPKLSDVVI